MRRRRKNRGLNHCLACMICVYVVLGFSGNVENQRDSVGHGIDIREQYEGVKNSDNENVWTTFWCRFLSVCLFINYSHGVNENHVLLRRSKIFVSKYLVLASLLLLLNIP